MTLNNNTSRNIFIKIQGFINAISDSTFFSIHKMFHRKINIEIVVPILYDVLRILITILMIY